MLNRQNKMISLPFPSRWGINADIAGRPIVRGILTINTLVGNQLTGSVSFQNSAIPITGFWDESNKQISFDSPYASFSGQLTMYDDATTRIRHLVLSGRFRMKPPSLHAGETGNWIAATDTPLIGPAIYTNALPPAGVYLLSDILYRQ
jgi:hypothetical protein